MKKNLVLLAATFLLSTGLFQSQAQACDPALGNVYSHFAGIYSNYFYSGQYGCYGSIRVSETCRNIWNLYDLYNGLAERERYSCMYY